MTIERMTRRQFGATIGAALASVTLGGASGDATQLSDGRLTVRPRASAVSPVAGTQPLGLATGRDGILLVPAGAGRDPLPLLLFLHGAGNTGEGVVTKRLGQAPQDARVVVLAPDSRGSSWDAIRGSFGPDIDFLNRALTHTFATVNVDPARIVIGGFSDGATYALSLGLINGDLFPKVVAFSAGFVIDGPLHGKPRVFMSHGTADEILPINQCGRPIAANLKKRGYDVTFREFNGGHEVPPDIAGDAMRWVAS